MNEVHLRVADGRRLSIESTQRISRLLDGEILPRLERPGRFVGLNRPRDLEAPLDQAPVHVLRPQPSEGPQFPRELEALRGALLESGHSISFGSTPTPDLARLLVDHRLRAFSHDRWHELDVEQRWLVWLDEPGQLLDLLTTLRVAGMPLRRAEGGPLILLTGPACLGGFPLAECYADRIVASVDAQTIVAELGKLSPRAAPSGPPAAAQPVEGERDEQPSTPCIGAAELGLPWLRQLHDPDGLPRTHLSPLAGSEALRRSLGLPDGATLRAAIEAALESGALELTFALGLPGESDADRAALIAFVRESAHLAGDRRRRIRLQLRLYRDSAFAPAQLAAWVEEIAGQLGNFRVRLPRISALLRDRRLLSATPADADWFESLLLDGMWSVESGLAQSVRAWDNPTDADVAPRPGRTDEIAHAPTGLRQRVREPQAAASTPADRWRRWRAMLPQQFDYRLEFARRGRLRHLSHRETGELLLDACREAGIEVATAGIAQPRPKLAFGPSLAVGVEGLREHVDLSLTRKHSHLKRLLEGHLPAEFQLARVRFVPGGIGRHGLSRVVEAEYEVAIPSMLQSELRARIDAQKALEQVLDIQLDESILRFVLDLRGEGKKLRPRDLIARLLDGMDVDLQLLKIRRTRLWAQAPGSSQLLAPLELVDRLVNDLRARERACA